MDHECIEAELPAGARRVAVFYDGSFAHAARAMLVARTVAATGRDVRVYGPAAYRTAVTGRGLAFEALDGVSRDTLYGRLAAGRPPWRASEIERNFHHDTERLRRADYDLVIADFRVTAILAARARGISTWSLTEVPCMPGYQTTSSFPASYVPAGVDPRWLDRLGATRVGRWVSAAIWRRFGRPWRQAARRCGFELRRGWADYNALGDRVWICDHPALFPRLELRAQDRWLGVMRWQDDSAARLVPDGRPLAYVAAGTQSALELSVVERCAETLLRRGWRVLCSAGARLGQWRLRHPALEVRAFVNEAGVLPHARVVVHPGGAMTCYHALWYGVPQLLLPAHAEQQFYAHALAQRGAGGWCRPLAAELRRLSRRLDEVLAPDVARAAVRLSDELRVPPRRWREATL